MSMSSKLNKRLELQEPVNVADGIGGYSVAWNKIADIWAEVKSSGGVRNRELLRDGKISEVNSYKIITRHRTDIKHNMRLLDGADIYNIRAVVNPDAGKEMLVIYADLGAVT